MAWHDNIFTLTRRRIASPHWESRSIAWHATAFHLHYLGEEHRRDHARRVARERAPRERHRARRREELGPELGRLGEEARALDERLRRARGVVGTVVVAREWMGPSRESGLGPSSSVSLLDRDEVPHLAREQPRRAVRDVREQDPAVPRDDVPIKDWVASPLGV